MKSSRLSARRHVLGWMAASVLTVTGLPHAQAAADAAASGKPLPVVASFSILGDMVREIGGTHVQLDTLVGRNSDAHGYEPTPQDARKLGAARLLVINGLGFESWLPRVQQASGFKGRVVEASSGIKVRAFDGDDDHDHDEGHDKDHDLDHGHDHDAGQAKLAGKSAPATPAAQGKHAHDHSQGLDHGDDHGPEDPHAWQSLTNAAIYARNIVNALAAADPANAGDYQQRADAYIARINALDANLRQAFGAIDASRRKLVTSHDAFGYFGDAYGVTFIPVSGLSTSAEPSAGDLARLIKQVKNDKVSAVFLENISSPRLAQQIARETGAKLGGTLYSDALASESDPAGTYLGMFEWNARQLLDALR